MKPLLITAGLAMLAGVACAAPVTETSSVSLDRSTHEVRYKVGGTARTADITISNGSGDSSQQSDIKVPLRNQHDGTEGIILSDVPEGTFLYISAQNQGSSGTITCAIEVDGIPVKTNQSSGGYTIATCSGRL
jgi:hypothetical protein